LLSCIYQFAENTAPNAQPAVFSLAPRWHKILQTIRGVIRTPGFSPLQHWLSPACH
jgi:hypothetical protein